METNTNTIAVYREIQELAGSFFSGLPVFRVDAIYLGEFNKPLDYHSLGVSNIEELLAKMGKMVVVFKVQKSNMKYVMPASMVDIRQRYLKDFVQELLDRHSGEILFNSFEDVYKDHFQIKLDYRSYALTNLEKLCESLKDILVVVAKPSGEKVIKAVKKRKRKESDE